MTSSEGADVALRDEGKSIFVKASEEGLLVVSARDEVGITGLSTGGGMLPRPVLIIVGVGVILIPLVVVVMVVLVLVLKMLLWNSGSGVG